MSSSDANPAPSSDDASPGQGDLQPLPDAPRIPHTPTEDVFGVLTGTFLAAMGLYLLEYSQAVTGGTAGVALLLTHGTPLSISALFILVNVPFFLLALWRKGWRFTLKTAVSVAVVSGFVLVCERFFPLGEVNPAFGVVAGNVLAGVALLIIFRHGASLGGFNVVAILAQERLGLRAGYVQMALDISVILLSLAVISPQNVLVSALGAVIMNVILAFNHRPGRYLA